MPKFSTRYERLDSPGLSFEGHPSLAVQEFKDDCDVNCILRKLVSGDPSVLVPPHREPLYADVSDFGDYADCLERVSLVRDSFDSLPAELREEFNNDPSVFAAWITDPANFDEAVEMGLIDRPVTELVPAQPVPVPEAVSKPSQEGAVAPEPSA